MIIRCKICGDEITEPHHFDKWYSIYDNTAWTFKINAESSGWAIGINKETNEIIESYMVIDVFD